MDTKVGIEYIQSMVYENGIPYRAEELIELLQQGEKYKLLVRDVESMLIPGYFKRPDTLKFFRIIYNKNKQKYFPKTSLIQE